MAWVPCSFVGDALPSARASATSRTRVFAATVFVVAMIAGLPALRGGFLSGDDRQFVLNFAPVNHPSLEHARELLTLRPHRDLYQPVPLLSFAVDFAVARAIGLVSAGESAEAAAWLFHLTNLLIHALSAMLVWWLIRRLHEDPRVALVAALLFAVHPMAVEPTAWINGRMISLSALFCLAALNAFEVWLERPRLWPAVLGMACVVLAMASKVQIGLPVLMVLLPLARRMRPRPAWWGLVAACAVITIGFAILDMRLTSRMHFLAAGAEALHGSRIARTLLALGWYFRHFVWPAGLASFHPAAPLVTWSHPGAISGAITVAAVLVVVGVSLRWSRVGAMGLAWFLATVAATLPLVPSRNVLAAERYAYLPNVGLFWMTAAFAVFVYRRLAGQGAAAARALRAGGVVCLIGLTAVSWRVASFYRDDIANLTRIAALYPETPGLSTRLAWEYHRQGRYAEAIEAARRDLAKHPKSMTARAYQVIGLCQSQMGMHAEAIQSLQAAVRADPKEGGACYRLGQVYEKAGMIDEAMAAYRQALERQPGYPAASAALASVLRRVGGLDEAAALYERILADNPYDAAAALALAEIDLSRGRDAAARARLQRLVKWMPENWAAWTNLGVCCQNAGRIEEAMDAYRRALAVNPQASTAAANLAGLLAKTGREAEARACLDRFLGAGAGRAALWTASEGLVAQGQWALARVIWEAARGREPNAADLEAAYAWTCALGMQWDAARTHATAALKSKTQPATAIAHMTMAMVALAGGDPAPAVAWANAPPDRGVPAYLDLRRLMRQALSIYGEARMEEPWPYYVVARLLQAEGDAAVAAAALRRFDELCTSPACVEQARKLGVALPAASPTSRPASSGQ